MAEFATFAIELATNLGAPLGDDERDRFRRVLEFRAEAGQVYHYLKLDLDNLENLFSLLDIESSLYDDKSGASSLREDLIYVLVKTLEITRRRDAGLEKKLHLLRQTGELEQLRSLLRGGNNPQAPYVRFCQRLRPHDTVITFNYDTVLEDAMLANNIGPDYGFGQPDWAGVERSQPLLKLHGSINFVSSDNGMTTEIVNPELLEAATDRYYAEGTPLLIPPTWNKGALKGTTQWVWARAFSALRNAAHITFVGYSLPDTDLAFRYLLASSLRGNPELRSIRVFDPDEETLERYRTFISPTLAEQGKFKTSAQPFPSDVEPIPK